MTGPTYRVIKSARRRQGLASRVKEIRLLGVGVKPGLAWAHPARAAPVEEVVEGDRLKLRFRAGH